MKKFYFIVIAILLGVHVNGVSQTVDHFSAYDYDDEITISGSKGEQNIYIPVKENLDFLNSYLNLEFTSSNVLDFDHSHITILIADTPLKTELLKNQNQLISFKIKLRKKHIVSGFIKITIKTDLKIPSVICKKNKESSYWVRLTENSFFSYKTLPVKESFVNKTISYTIPDIKYIVLSEKNDIKDIEYASFIKFYLKRVYGLDIKIKTINSFENEVINNAIILIPYNKLNQKIKDKLPEIKKENTGLVTVYKDEFKEKNGLNIVVTGKNNVGFKKAAYFLLQKHLINSSYVDYIFVNEQAKLFDIPKRKDYEPIYFNQLNAPNIILEGVGNLQSNILLPRSNFGSNVKNMEVKIYGKYRPLEKEEQGFFNLFYNDKFLTSYKLDNTGDLNINFSFDDIVMQQDNNFKYEFYFVPKNGICNASSTANFYGQIDIVNSYFKPIGYDLSSTLSFFRFPENFQSKPITIYTDLEPSIKLVNTISELVDIINPGAIGLSSFIYPKIKNAELKDITKDEETSKIIISSNNNKFSEYFGDSPFIKFKENSVEYNSEEINPFFNLEYQKDLGFNQLFYHQGLPIMLINIPKEYSEETLLSLIANIREQTMSNTGNIIVSNNDNAYFFDLRDNNEVNDKNYISNKLDGFWGKYRLFIISILLILGILMLVFIFQKSKESKAKIKDEK